jgi:hypothetical protein
MPIALDVSVNATANANGVARGSLGPTVYGHSWNISRITTTTNDFNKRNEVRVYLNGESQQRLLAGSYNGNQDFNETTVTLQTLDKLIPVWSGCTPGTVCTLQVQGTITDRRG